MTKSIYAFSSGDVQVQFWYGDQKESSIIIPLRGFICEKNLNGSIYGTFEIGTGMYDSERISIKDSADDPTADMVENELSSCDMDIVVFPKKFLGTLVRCNNVRIKSKQVIIANVPSTIIMRYYFSNRPDWEDHKLEIPEDKSNINPDPFYRIARALEDIKKVLGDKSEVNSVDDIIMSVEEYTELILNGKVPKRYQHIEDEVKCQFRS
jgi:hypothetical protein